jgi:hypothetical protein
MDVASFGLLANMAVEVPCCFHGMLSVVRTAENEIDG